MVVNAKQISYGGDQLTIKIGVVWLEGPDGICANESRQEPHKGGKREVCGQVEPAVATDIEKVSNVTHEGYLKVRHDVLHPNGGSPLVKACHGHQAEQEVCSPETKT